jgi:cobaltochelatase CobS
VHGYTSLQFPEIEEERMVMTVIKDSDRTLRGGCDVCGDPGPFYKGFYAELPHGEVLIVKADETQAPLCKRGGLVAERFVHVCQAVQVDEPPQMDEVQQRVDEQAHSDVGDGDDPQSDSAIAGDDGDVLAMLRKLLGSQVDESQVRRIAERAAREAIDGIVFPTKTVVIREDEHRQVEGLSHYQLAEIIAVASTPRATMLIGPAGSGKTHIAEQVAEAMSLPFYSLSLTVRTPESALRGLIDGYGTYHRTDFREAFENGGLFCLDEVDNGHPNTLNVINSAAANGHMAFPDGMVKKSPNFVLLCSGNTFGRGANREYVGRNQLDAAFLNRFNKVFVEYDTALERSLCEATGVESVTVDKVLALVHKVRDRAETNGIRTIVSPRNSVGMCQIIAAGLTFDRATDIALRDGLADDVWAKLTA